MPCLEISSIQLRLVRCRNIRQQAENTRTLYFTGEFALATSAVSSLAARLNLTHFVDEAFQRIDFFIVEAFTFGAIFSTTATAATGTWAKFATLITIITTTGTTGAVESIATTTVTSVASTTSIVI
jgi:hypothetical protein